MILAEGMARARRTILYVRDAARRAPVSVVWDCDEHPRPRGGDVLVVGCECLPFLRPERRIKRLLVCEVQLGDPVVGVLTGVSGSHQARRLRALKAR